MKVFSSIFRVGITLVLTCIAFVLGWMLWNYYEYSPWTRDGRVRCLIASIAPEVEGNVVEVVIRDNELVRKGDLLLRIDPASYELAVAQAEGALAAAKVTLANYQTQLARRMLLPSSAISQESLEQAGTNARSAQASVQQANAALATAKLNLSRTRIFAPVDGYIDNLVIHKGTYVSVGTKVMAITVADSFYIYGYFEETKLRNIAIGDRVSIRPMAYERYAEGHVVGVARAITDRDNTPSDDLVANVNPVFSWVRLAQRIPVHIAIDYVPPEMTLTAGMTTTLVVEPLRTKPLFSGSLFQKDPVQTRPPPGKVIDVRPGASAQPPDGVDIKPN